MNYCMPLVILLYLAAPWMIMQCKGQGHANMATNIKIEIEKHRQTERIKKQILKELENVGAKVNKGDQGSGDHKATDYSVGPFQRKNPHPEPSNTLHHTEETSEQPAKQVPILVLGDRASDKKDSCLSFDVGKYINATQRILPFRVSLWIHVRMTRGKGRRRKEEKSLYTRTKRSASKERKRRNKNRKQDKNKKNKKKKRGRRIKLLVSNGTKTFAQIRKRVTKPMWIEIDLPISQFPDVITSRDNFKLCVKCKRCNKKIKLDLFQSPRRQRKKDQDIPFIHFEDRSLLPHSNSRNRRSTGATTSRRRHHHAMTSQRRHEHIQTSKSWHLSKQCCQEEIYEENIDDISSSIVSPLSINITFCRTVSQNSDPVNNAFDLDQNTDVKCTTNSKADFIYTYIDKHYVVRHGVIKNLIPNSCKCVSGA